MFLNLRYREDNAVARDDINAFLGSGTVFTGTLNFQGAVRIDGCYNGDIQSDGALIAGKDSKIEGILHVGEFSLAGNFSGEVFAKRRVIVHKGGVFKGSVHSPALVVEEGAMLDGTIIMAEQFSEQQDEPVFVE